MGIRRLKGELDVLTYKQVRIIKMSLMHAAEIIPNSYAPPKAVMTYAACSVNDALSGLSANDLMRLKKVRLKPSGEEYAIREILIAASEDEPEMLCHLFRTYQGLAREKLKSTPTV